MTDSKDSGEEIARLRHETDKLLIPGALTVNCLRYGGCNVRAVHEVEIRQLREANSRLIDRAQELEEKLLGYQYAEAFREQEDQ